MTAGTLRATARTALRHGWTLAAALLLAACGDDPVSPDDGALFRVEVSGEHFLVQVRTDGQIEELQARLASGARGVVIGGILAGDGGFNGPWGWHMDPATVHTADMAIELCDGRPSLVEADLPYWLGTVKQFCPWGAKVVQRVR